MRSSRLWSIGAVALGWASGASAACHLTQYFELPVTMSGSRALVSAKIDGREARFILDSGAFFSTLSPATAQTYNLKLSNLPPEFYMRGINGATSASLTTVRRFSVGGVDIPDVKFLVGGTDFGQVGFLGQNLLGLADAEYDLGHGVVRVIKPSGCKVEELGYWPSEQPLTILPIEERTATQPHIVATVTLNGVRLKAVFDTGAPLSAITMAAARRAGVTPTSPGVKAAGFTSGLGTRTLRTWLGQFDKLEIGGEMIPHPQIRFSEAEFADADMLIGADFFLTHHIYVANSAKRMVMTYDGGPLFGIKPSGARLTSGQRLDLTDRSAAPTDADGFARRGAALLSTHQVSDALAAFDQAVTLAPTNGDYLRQRAVARLANRQPLLAAADLDKAVTLNPNDIEAHGLRAQLKLSARDPAGAAEDLRALDRLLPPAASERMRIGGMADAAGLPELALANYDAWLKAHTADANRPTALNGRCWALGQLGRDLDRALSDCNAALKARPNVAAYLDSRGLVRLRRGELPLALADYDAAIRLNPQNGWSLLMRSVVKRRMGDAAGADADRTAALRIAPLAAERAAKLGLTS
ncbi:MULTISPECIES: aspartyl protease family protein [Sphingomonas]|uniref:aspartyl protease family protein n=1 Tax=Sphingomonas TaxID=13687 RepID=UPI000DEFEF98|nr:MULTISPECIES: aspartyl protease family protein [Sphingomonas]